MKLKNIQNRDQIQHQIFNDIIDLECIVDEEIDNKINVIGGKTNFIYNEAQGIVFEIIRIMNDLLKRIYI